MRKFQRQGLAQARSWRPWVWLLGPPALVLTLLFVLTGQFGAVGALPLQLALALAGAWALARLEPPTLWVARACTALLGVVAVLGGVGLLLGPTTWQALGKTSTRALVGSLVRDEVRGLGTRAWSVPPGVKRVDLVFEARLERGTTGWDWFNNDRGFNVTGLTDETGAVFTRVSTPTGGDPYLMRSYDTGRATGGRTFRVELTMRSPQRVPAEGCRGVRLQVWYEGGGATCQAVGLGPEWQTYSATWQVPAAARSKVVRVVLNDFDGLSYDVKDVRLFERASGRWRRLEPLIPEGAYLELAWPGKAGEVHSGYSFIPTPEWQSYTVAADDASLAAARTVTAVLHTGAGLGVAVRAATLAAAPGPGQVRPQFRWFRQRFWFGHTNLASHTVVALGLVAMSFGPPATWAWGAALTVFGVALTGSSAAWLAGLGGTVALLLLRLPKTGKLVVTGLLFVAAAGFLYAGLPDGVTGDLSRRAKIWSLAVQAFRAEPLTGLGENAFGAYWSRAYPAIGTERVPHAHNLWLQLASSYGLLGVAAALWLTAGVLYLAWRWGRWRGLAFAAPFFVLNLFDYTFFYAGVLFPLILGLNALRQRSSPVQAEP